MAIEKTLQRVDALLEAGDLAGARERLRSLVAYAPRRLDLRERLADVYRRAGDPQQAGRWGYLSEQTTQDELQAFTRSHRGDARSMMHALRWEGTEDDLGSDLAERRLRDLRARAEDAAGGPVGWRDPPPAPAPVPWWDEAVGYVLIALVLLCFVVGAVTIVRWLIDLVF